MCNCKKEKNIDRYEYVIVDRHMGFVDQDHYQFTPEFCPFCADNLKDKKIKIVGNKMQMIFYMIGTEINDDIEMKLNKITYDEYGWIERLEHGTYLFVYGSNIKQINDSVDFFIKFFNENKIHKEVEDFEIFMDHELI